MSTILSADDLNDFIAPGAVCIKPVEVKKTSETAEIAIGPDGVPVEQIDDVPQQLQTASISLTDCLACSGCITSAETVLLELQSPKELFRALKDEPHKTFVVSICPQTRASLAAAYRLSIEQVDRKLLNLFIDELGFKHAVGTQLGRALSLKQTLVKSQSSTGPVLCSVCPGWTLYAEKTHPHVLPYLSTVKSPQQITGSLLKQYVASQGVPMDSIYHVSVMPCFDKKLESARPDNALGDNKEVDLVITPKEIVQMLGERFDQDFGALPESSYQSPAPFASSWNTNLGSSSGGYLWFILESVKLQFPGSQVEVIPGKNSDIVDFNLKHNGQVVWRGAQIYGFRNIQNLVRKLKPGKRVVTKRGTDPLSYNYVEVMACPGGCTNGGGQIGAEAGITPKSWHSAVEAAYKSIASIEVTPPENLAHGSLVTQFKPVEPDTSIPEVLAVGSQW